MKKQASMSSALFIVFIGLFVITGTTLADSSAPSKFSDFPEAKAFLGKWEGYRIHEGIGDRRTCVLEFIEQGNDKVKFTFRMGPGYFEIGKREGAVSETGEASIVLRQGKPTIEAPFKTKAGVVFYFYLENGKLVGGSSSANMDAYKWSLTKK